jgi:methyltransferase (TIGR00027 family)
MLCRKRYADDQVLAALDTTDQLVVLGAGFDTRAYRVADPDRVRVYEVDLPANIDAKRTRVRAVLGAVPGHVRLVPVDFESGDLAESLTAAGLDFERPVMVVWEAVTQYLTEDAVRRTFALLARAAPGSRLIFTFVRQDFLDGTNAYGAEGAYRRFVARQRIWRYGMYPDRVAAFLAEYGWTEDEQVGAAEYRERYLEPAGRDLPVSEIERFASATRS